MVDTRDLKSLAGNCVPVRVGPPAPDKSIMRICLLNCMSAGGSVSSLSFFHLKPVSLGFEVSF